MRRFLLISAVSSLALPALAGDAGFRTEYDYPWEDAAWYSNVGGVDPWLDFAPATDIPSQQGDDFCSGFEPGRVAFRQGPDPDRTRMLHTHYEYLHTSVREFGVSCPDRLFADGFES